MAIPNDSTEVWQFKAGATEKKTPHLAQLRKSQGQARQKNGATGSTEKCQFRSGKTRTKNQNLFLESRIQSFPKTKRLSIFLSQADKRFKWRDLRKDRRRDLQKD